MTRRIGRRRPGLVLPVLLALQIVSCADDEVTEPDTTGPSRIVDLEAIPAGPGSILLIWTAPADAGGGRAAAYDVRFAEDDLSGSNWDEALQPDRSPRPGPAGNRDSLLVGDLPLLTRWAFAIRSVDLAGNRSPVSNVATAAVPPPPPDLVASGGEAPAWSPDGARIAFVRLAGFDPPEDPGLFVVELETASETRLVPVSGVLDPSWSPDGSRIACCVPAPGRERQIWIVPAQGGGPTVLTATGENRHPRWSPDGGRIFFLSDREGSIEIWSVLVTGGEAVRITEKGPVEDFDLSPDGTKIVFAASPYGASDLWTISSSGGFAFSLVAGTARRIDPEWSPDGGSIAFLEANEGEATRMHLVPWSGGPSNPLATVAGARWPRWSPDGTRLAVRSEHGGASAILVIDAQSGSALPAAGPAGGPPDWSPDGNWIAYTGTGALGSTALRVVQVRLPTARR